MDIVELAAIYASLPGVFPNDFGKKKAKWREGLQQSLADMLKKRAANTLPKQLLRNPDYEGQLGMYVGRDSMMDVRAVSGDAFSPRKSFELLKSMGRRMTGAVTTAGAGAGGVPRPSMLSPIDEASADVENPMSHLQQQQRESELVVMRPSITTPTTAPSTAPANTTGAAATGSSKEQPSAQRSAAEVEFRANLERRLSLQRTPEQQQHQQLQQQKLPQQQLPQQEQQQDHGVREDPTAVRSTTGEGEEEEQFVVELEGVNDLV